jgi:hypothetical protein
MLSEGTIRKRLATAQRLIDIGTLGLVRHFFVLIGSTDPFYTT